MENNYTDLPQGCTLLNNNLIGVDMSFYTNQSIQEELVPLISKWRKENDCYYSPINMVKDGE